MSLVVHFSTMELGSLSSSTVARGERKDGDAASLPGSGLATQPTNMPRVTSSSPLHPNVDYDLVSIRYDRM